MKMPFVSRIRLEAAETALRAAENLRQFDRAALAASEKLRVAAEERLERADQERRILVDRIAQLSGQPPIYAAPPAPIAAAAGETPAARRLLTFDDVHEAFQTAVREKQFTLARKPD